jgi:hypothetical protein
LGRGRAIAAGNAEESRHGFALIAAERVRHAHHDAEIERAQDTGHGELPQRIARGNAFAHLIVAGSATFLIDGFAGALREKRGNR